MFEISNASPSLFHRIWPIAVVALSMIAAVTWTGIIGYGVYRLSALAFYITSLSTLLLRCPLCPRKLPRLSPTGVSAMGQ